jgi:hypothetical protein
VGRAGWRRLRGRGGLSELREVGLYMREGWSEPLMFYSFRCKIHGVVVNYRQGYAERLHCPVCDELLFRTEASKFTQKAEVTQ